MKCTFIEYPNLPRLEVSSTDSYNDADKDSKRKKRKNHIRAIPVAVKIRQNIFASRHAKKKKKNTTKPVDLITDSSPLFVRIVQNVVTSRNERSNCYRYPTRSSEFPNLRPSPR